VTGAEWELVFDVCETVAGWLLRPRVRLAVVGLFGRSGAMNGFKTYTAALLTVLGSVVLGFTGGISWVQAAFLVVPAVVAACVRHGVSTSTASVLEKIDSFVSSAEGVVPKLTDEKVALVERFGGDVPDAMRLNPRNGVQAMLFVALLLVGLGGCKSGQFPGLAVQASGFGVTVGVDTRPVTEAVGVGVGSVLAGVAGVVAVPASQGGSTALPASGK